VAHELQVAQHVLDVVLLGALDRRLAAGRTS
jgi:hypothetical protein